MQKVYVIQYVDTDECKVFEDINDARDTLMQDLKRNSKAWYGSEETMEAISFIMEDYRTIFGKYPRIEDYAYCFEATLFQKDNDHE